MVDVIKGIVAMGNNGKKIRFEEVEGLYQSDQWLPVVYDTLFESRGRKVTNGQHLQAIFSLVQW